MDTSDLRGAGHRLSGARGATACLGWPAIARAPIQSPWLAGESIEHLVDGVIYSTSLFTLDRIRPTLRRRGTSERTPPTLFTTALPGGRG